MTQFFSKKKLPKTRYSRSQKPIFYKMSFGKRAIFYEALLRLKAYQNLTSNGFFENSYLKMQKWVDVAGGGGRMVKCVDVYLLCVRKM